eukprot:TRINITY_DN2381_c1_g1_i1.p1 TRINITY_DN2381_c1_g1~~TRINITY_DN2381_c1_g1_i1.p1  ORF type:complete len:140 (-),score=46.62 TRINITY_DN2381_c1_g1_i1:211-630(-)
MALMMRAMKAMKAMKSMKAMKVMKAMKGMKSMKGMKAMKAMKTSVIAKGKLAKAVVFRGSKEKTQSGLTKTNLMRSKRGKIVSKKQSAAGRKAYTHIAGWNKAVQQAKKALNITGFVAVNGKNAEGRALYAKAKSLYHA